MGINYCDRRVFAYRILLTTSGSIFAPSLNILASGGKLRFHFLRWLTHLLHIYICLNVYKQTWCRCLLALIYLGYFLLLPFARLSSSIWVRSGLDLDHPREIIDELDGLGYSMATGVGLKHLPLLQLVKIWKSKGVWGTLEDFLWLILFSSFLVHIDRRYPKSLIITQNVSGSKTNLHPSMQDHKPSILNHGCFTLGMN